MLEQIGAEYGSLQAFRVWGRDHGLPSLSEIGVSVRDYEALAQDATLSSSDKANPVDLGVPRLLDILQAS